MKNAFWIIIENLVNLYQGFICSYFIAEFLSFKPSTNKKVFYICCGTIHALMISLFNYITIFESFASVLYIAELLFFAVIMLNGNLMKKLFACIIPMFTGFIISLSMVELVASINNMPLEQLASDTGYARITTLLSIQILYFLSFKAILRVLKNDDDKFKLKDWGILSLILLDSIAIAAIIMIVSIKTNNPGIRMYSNIAVVLIILLDGFMYFLIVSINKKNKLEKALELLRIQEFYQEQYIENAKLQFDVIRKYRHDTKNHFLAVCELISNGEIGEALDYAKKNTDVLNKTQPFVNTENSIVNAIINSKLSSASGMGIQISCMSVKSFKGLDDIDLCSILSNPLDNAISACLNDTSCHFHEVIVELSCENERYYTFVIKNTIGESVLDNNPRLITTKNIENNHGIGTQIVKEIARKYNGRVDYYEDGDLFCCQINLVGKI